MSHDELPRYVEEVLALKARYPGYVLLGIEADFRPDTVEPVGELLAAYPFDYVIGSVHFVEDWGVDDPRSVDGFDTRDIDELYLAYYDLVGRAAETGLFTIMGHLDLVKKFGHRPTHSLETTLDALARRLAAAGVAVEINTAGLRKPVREMYPAPPVLRALARHQVPVTFGSDAHAPLEVGKDFDRAASLARECGYQHYLRLQPVPGGRARTAQQPLPSPAAPR